MAKPLDVFEAAKGLNDALAAYNVTSDRRSLASTHTVKRVAALVNCVEIRTYNRERRLELEVTPAVAQWPIVVCIVKTGKYMACPVKVFVRAKTGTPVLQEPPPRAVKPTTPTP